MGVYKSRQEVETYKESKRRELAKAIEATNLETHSILVKDMFGVNVYYIVQEDFDGYTVSYLKGREAVNCITKEVYIKYYKVLRFKELEWLNTVELAKVCERTKIDKIPDEYLTTYVNEEGIHE